MIGSFFNPILAGGGTASMNVDFIASTQSFEFGATVSFTNLSSPTPLFNFWDFGDGSFSTASNPIKLYEDIGTYSVTLNACDNVSGGIETKNDYIFVEVPETNLPLDILNNDAYFGFSLRKLRIVYTGPAIRVRRSSDNTEQDIGFDANGDLDTTALLSFVGDDDGFVRTWYDQSGSRDAGNSNTSQQPRIVNGGVVDTLEGKPAIFWSDQTTRYLFFSAISVAEVRDGTCFIMARGGRLSNTTGTILSGNQNGAPSFRIEGTISSTIGFALTSAVISTHIRLNPNSTPPLPSFSGIRMCTIVSRGTSDRSMWVTGGSTKETITTLTTTVGDSFSGDVRNIGRSLSAVPEQFEGHMSELIFCPGDKSSLREAIQDSFFDYY